MLIAVCRSKAVCHLLFVASPVRPNNGTDYLTWLFAIIVQYVEVHASFVLLQCMVNMQKISCFECRLVFLETNVLKGAHIFFLLTVWTGSISIKLESSLNSAGLERDKVDSIARSNFKIDTLQNSRISFLLIPVLGRGRVCFLVSQLTQLRFGTLFFGTIDHMWGGS